MPLTGVDDVKKMLAKNKKLGNEKIRGVYFSGLANIIRQTPVDEGRARNNWFLSVSITFSLSGRTSKKGGGGSERSLQGMPKWVLNKKIYLTNNLPYVALLEYGGYPSPVKKGSYDKRKKKYEILSINGFSKQAPNGWVRKTLIEMQNKIRALS